MSMLTIIERMPDTRGSQTNTACFVVVLAPAYPVPVQPQIKFTDCAKRQICESLWTSNLVKNSPTILQVTFSPNSGTYLFGNWKSLFGQKEH
eukprot:scaffold194424_cov46-Cyclotella_meneghiniana.AAC.2